MTPIQIIKKYKSKMSTSGEQWIILDQVEKEIIKEIDYPIIWSHMGEDEL